MEMSEVFDNLKELQDIEAKNDFENPKSLWDFEFLFEYFL